MSNESSGKTFYGWWIVAASSIIIFFSTGIVFYTFGVFMKPLEAHFGWSRATISLSVVAWALVYGFSGPLVGVFIHKYGAKTVIAVCATFTGVCYLLLSGMSQLYQLFVLMTIVGLGSAGITLIPNQTLISNWFEKYRGRAMGIMMMGIGFGGLLMPQLANKMIDAYSWRTSFFVLGLLILSAIIPVTLLLVRTKPSDMGLRPDGIGSDEGDDADHASEQDTGAVGLTVKRSLRTSTFWLLFVAFALLVFGESGLILHFVAFADDAGVSAQTASFFLGLTAGISAPGRLGFGYLADRWNPRTLIAFTHGLHAVAVLILVVVFLKMGIRSPLVLGVFSVIYGISLGGSAVLLPVMTGRCFGILNFSKVLGILMTGFALGVIGGPFMAGVIADRTGSYEMAFTIFVIAFAVAAAVIALIDPDKHKSEFTEA